MKNIKKIILMLSMFGILASVISCNKENKLTAEVAPGPTFANTPLGLKQKEFFEKYDVLFQYNWDRNVFARNAVADPASVDDVLPYMEIMEELYFKAIDVVAEDKSFVKIQTPLTVYLIGSGINYGGAEAFGESTAGQAGNIQPNRLTLGGLSTFGKILRKKNSDTDFLNAIYNAAVGTAPNQAGLVGFFYHEYTHYINSRYDIPVPFALAAVNNYLKGTNAWQNTDNATAFAKGFFIPYGMQNEMEDFATYVQIIVWQSDAQIKSTFIKSEESRKKYAMVLDYYKKLGLDLSNLRLYLQSDQVVKRILEIKRKYEQ
jgi:substrate import-associated zinc metallohydrolase lipoprotein